MDDDHILILDENNWQFLWCNTNFQGINAIKAIARLLRKKVIHIKSCCVPNDKDHIKRYQELQKYKQARKDVLS